jgi:PLD-like domain
LPKSVIHVRTRTKIPHNIVKLVGGAPVEVWTGSTNFTDTGFFGQTNVGHQGANTKLAKTYLDYWTDLVEDPVHSKALKSAIELTPNPPNAIPESSTAVFFSPRKADNMLDWYGQRIGDTASLAMMTIPFNVATTILAALGRKRDAMRFVILEGIPTPEVNDAEKRNHGKLAFSNGAILGKSFIKFKRGIGGAKVAPIPNSGLDQWFVDEELARPTNKGHVFFVHAKVLLIDPLSDDPLVCSGSANFSKNSLTANDENMLLIRGNTRVADIYMTELDRIFRHFRARDIINATADQHKNVLLLDTTDGWIEPNFKNGTFKNNRRLLFFPVTNDTNPWSVVAATDADPFKDEDARAAKVRADKSAKAKARKGPAAKKAKTAKKAKKTKKAKKAKKSSKSRTAAKRKRKTTAAKKRRTPSKSKAKSKTARKTNKKR